MSGGTETPEQATLRWGRGMASFAASFVFMWVVGYFFCNSVPSYEYDLALNKHVLAPTTYKHRIEGRAITHIGLHGVHGVPDVSKINKPKAIVWGDSYVEAYQVDDAGKTPQMVNALLQARGQDYLFCFGVGTGGDSAADYCFDIPKYERLAGPVAAHFIVITTLDDLMPDQPDDTICGVFRSHPLRLEYLNRTPRHGRLKEVLDRWRLYFLWEPMRALFRETHVRFRPGRQTGPAAPRAVTSRPGEEVERRAAWSFLLAELRSRTTAPIAFVYCPPVPMLDRGAVRLSDASAEVAVAFQAELRDYHMGFIDMTQDFVEYYRTTRRFPMGFAGSFPGFGHLNPAGHRLVAQRIADYLMQIEGR